MKIGRWIDFEMEIGVVCQRMLNSCCIVQYFIAMEDLEDGWISPFRTPVAGAVTSSSPSIAHSH